MPASKPAQPVKPMTKRRLENIAKFHIERFATTAGHLRQVLERRAYRALRAHGGGRPPSDESRAVIARGGDKTECAAWIDEIVARFVRTGLVDDARYAMDRAATLRRLGKSPGKIRAALTAKRVDRALIDVALDATETSPTGKDAALEAAIAYARRRRLGPFGKIIADAKARRAQQTKDLAALGRAGFSYAIAKRIVGAASVEELA